MLRPETFWDTNNVGLLVVSPRVKLISSSTNAPDAVT